jgi:hypothetical protein
MAFAVSIACVGLQPKFSSKMEVVMSRIPSCEMVLTRPFAFVTVVKTINSVDTIDSVRNSGVAMLRAFILSICSGSGPVRKLAYIPGLCQLRKILTFDPLPPLTSCSAHFIGLTNSNLRGLSKLYRPIDVVRSY